MRKKEEGEGGDRGRRKGNIEAVIGSNFRSVVAMFVRRSSDIVA